MITIFTPTYNRAHLLNNVYQSLIQQSNKDFEWLIVDDGSTDNTQQIVQQYIDDKKLQINYIRKPNGGKHSAINAGAKAAKGAYFFILDSDDKLPNDALQLITEKISLFSDQLKQLGGIVFRKAHYDGSLVGSPIPEDGLIANSYTIRYKHGVSGDLAEIFKTDVIREHPFPENNEERFCPEVLVWHRIANHYDLLFFNDIVYLCEYLDGGLTASITKVRMQSPLNTCQTYKELAESAQVPFKIKIKSLLNFWRFYYAAPITKRKIIKVPNSVWNPVLKTLGYLIHLKDKKALT